MTRRLLHRVLAALLSAVLISAVLLASPAQVEAESETVRNDGVLMITDPPDFFPDSECGFTVYLAVRSFEQAAEYQVTYTLDDSSYDVTFDEVRGRGTFKTELQDERVVYPLLDDGRPVYDSHNFIGQHLFSVGSETYTYDECLDAVLQRIEQRQRSVVSSTRTDWFDDEVPRGDAHMSMDTYQDGNRCQYVLWWSFPDIPGVDIFPYIDSSRPDANSVMTRASLTNQLPDNPDITADAGFSNYSVPGRIAVARQSGSVTEKCASWKYRRLGGTTLSLAGGPVTPPPLLCADRVITIDMRFGASGIGTNGDDVIHGTAGNDLIEGRGGNDTICGADGNDAIIGGDGDDVILGGRGNDLLRGNAGRDGLLGMDGDDRILGGVGDDDMQGGAGDDFIGGFGGADRAYGGGGNDVIYGGFGADELYGGAGNDTIRGLVGNDIINGNAGADTLDGDRGNDTIGGQGGADLINGGNANDVLDGGGGNDVVNGGKGDDIVSGGAGTDVCAGNRHNTGDTGNADCETAFGFP